MTVYNKGDRVYIISGRGHGNYGKITSDGPTDKLGNVDILCDDGTELGNIPALLIVHAS